MIRVVPVACRRHGLMLALAARVLADRVVPDCCIDGQIVSWIVALLNNVLPRILSALMGNFCIFEVEPARLSPLARISTGQLPSELIGIWQASQTNAD